MTKNINNTTVLVTGATGFIGGAICFELKQKGYYVLGIDKVYRPHIDSYIDEFICEDFISSYSIDFILNNKPDVIIHCAGTSLVGPSVVNPSEYYTNNVSKTIALLDIITQALPDTLFMFSSSASVYDTDKTLTEESPKKPISAYARSKYMVELVMDSYAKSYGLKYTCFRYFNACGAVDDIHGQPPGESHIFARLMECVQDSTSFALFGEDYKTKDGTCVRDYIHVLDIANAHVQAIEKRAEGVYNLGNGFGYSNMDCIKVVSDFYNKPIKVNVEQRRFGDTDSLIADASYFKVVTGWQPERDIKDIVVSLDKWYNSDTFRSYKNDATNHLQVR